MIVVIDTNIFVRDHHMLGSEAGQQFLKLLEVRQGRLFIPEILRTEYTGQAQEAAREHQGKLKGRATDLRMLLSREINHDILPEAAVLRAVEERLRTLEAITRVGPSADELAQVTGRRVIAKKPPHTKQEHGYKDCMIWEAIRTLPAGSTVRLISRDGDFYENQALSTVLKQEARDLNLDVRAFKKLEPLLQELRAQTLELDQAAVELADKIQQPPQVETAGAIVPVKPALPEAAPAATGQELQHALGRIHETFENTDARVLGYIAYLEMINKDQLFNFLEQVGMAPDVARNSAERLALTGVIRDTGHHYLVEDRALALAAASRVEEEILVYLNETGGYGT